jgi:hypothetical protein
MRTLEETRHSRPHCDALETAVWLRCTCLPITLTQISAVPYRAHFFAGWLPSHRRRPRAKLPVLPSLRVGMVVVVTMMVMVLRESGARKEYDHGEQQSFFHGTYDSNNGRS